MFCFSLTFEIGGEGEQEEGEEGEDGTKNADNDGTKPEEVEKKKKPKKVTHFLDICLAEVTNKKKTCSCQLEEYIPWNQILRH